MNLCSVSDKISCIFETSVLTDTLSHKRQDQMYRVVAAADQLWPEAAACLSQPSCRATEKLDGTCAIVRLFNDRPWLWARHDRKPTKAAEKRFRTSQRSSIAGGDCSFQWNVETDFKEIPPNWIAAGSGQPDAGGHIPGWVPIDPKSKTHCWHLSVVDLEETGLALVLRPRTSLRSNDLEIVLLPLEDLVGCSFELIGTNVNANPYHLGSRSRPLHFLVRHGIFQLHDIPAPNELPKFFDRDEGAIEGIVWHCDDGTMFKLHRHHLGLKWPVEKPHLLQKPVTINLLVDDPNKQSDVESSTNGLFLELLQINGHAFDSVSDINFQSV